MTDQEDKKDETQEQDKAQTKQVTKKITFARPPFAQELFTADTKRRFDQLPDWERQLVRKLIEHGDLKRAAEEAGVARYAKENVDLVSADKKTIIEALDAGGVTPAYLTSRLRDCLEGKCIKFDQHQNPMEYIDMRLVLNALRLVHELRGDFPDKKKPSAQNNTGELFADVQSDET